MMAEGSDAGEMDAAFALLFPAATMTGMPRLTAEATALLMEAE